MRYAGIGSRQTPPDVLRLMHDIAGALAELGWHLHSGHAEGADRAFEDGCDAAGGTKSIWTARDADWDCIFLSSHFHPAWDRCGSYARALHGRNAYIALGQDLLTPVDMVVCWTPGAAVTGGTGQALRIAQHYSIPVRNLADPIVRERTERWLS